MKLSVFRASEGKLLSSSHYDPTDPQCYILLVVRLFCLSEPERYRPLAMGAHLSRGRRLLRPHGFREVLSPDLPGADRFLSRLRDHPLLFSRWGPPLDSQI